MARTVSAQDLSFNFKAPTDYTLSSIYEMFIAIGDNLTPQTRTNVKAFYKKLPGKRWYSDMQFLIENYGYEEYRNHVESSLNGLIDLQRAHNRVAKYIKQDRKLPGYRNIRNYVDGSSYGSFNEAPTHFYFYYSEKGRYLKGMILSISCIPDPKLLKLLETFAIECPFQVGSVSQAPTGLYVYDALETFTRISYEKGVPCIMNMQRKIKQTWAQKKFATALNKIAKLNLMDVNDLIEIGVPSFDLDENHIYRKKIGAYTAILSFPQWNKKELLWKNDGTEKVRKSIPKEVKENNPETLKYLKVHIKSIEGQLIAHSIRIEEGYKRNKDIEVSDWIKRYMKSPLIGVLSQNLFWIFSNDSEKITVYIQDNKVYNTQGYKLDITNYSFVKLWHPLDTTLEELNSLKHLISELKIVQPFKQVEREFYRDKDFVQNNREAEMIPNILAQLCKSRGWTASANHKLKLPKQNLTAILRMNDGSDHQLSYMYTRAKSVKMHSLQLLRNKKEISTDDICPQLYSEIVRDIDLFIHASKVK